MPPPASPETIFLAGNAAVRGIQKTWRESLRIAECSTHFSVPPEVLLTSCGGGIFRRHAGEKKAPSR